MLDGAVVALVSDAGTPLVSDPGFVLVRECVAAGLAVEVLPGAVGGRCRRSWRAALPADRWTFAGFLPRKRAELERASLASPETLVAFESPRRVAATLAVLAEIDPERQVAVCRELTKIHEEVVRGTAAELAARYAPSHRGGDRAGGRRCGAPGPRRTPGRRWTRSGGWWRPEPSRGPRRR